MLEKYWPVGVGIGVILVSQLCYACRGKIPNSYNFGSLVGAWAICCGAHGMHVIQGDLFASLFASLLALAISLPGYRWGIGAGCVKSQVAFGAWIGCGLPFNSAAIVTAVSTILALILTFVGIRIVVARFESKGEETPMFFPAQLTFTIGSVLGVAICWLAFQPG
jgi:hypothetical protein